MISANLLGHSLFSRDEEKKKGKKKPSEMDLPSINKKESIVKFLDNFPSRSFPLGLFVILEILVWKKKKPQWIPEPGVLSTWPRGAALSSSRGTGLGPLLQTRLAPLLRLSITRAAPMAALGSAFKKLQVFLPAKEEREETGIVTAGVSQQQGSHAWVCARRSRVGSHGAVHLQGRLWQLEAN